MTKPSLLILAAGMGSRYGGLKQIDPVGPHYAILMDYAVYDALKAGFKKVIFLITKKMETAFKSMINSRYSNKLNIEYAYQDLQQIPKGYTVPGTRSKPWGTGHAILCAKNVINEPFAVINADDYYGASSFQSIYDMLNDLGKDSKEFVMIGFKIENTLSEYGTVCRGVCDVNDGILVSVIERENIEQNKSGIFYKNSRGLNTNIKKGVLVSMNLWGFTPDTLFPILENQFEEFIRQNIIHPKIEFYIPQAVDDSIQKYNIKVRVRESSETWFGLTYLKDRNIVKKNIQDRINAGYYPENLFREV